MRREDAAAIEREAAFGEGFAVHQKDERDGEADEKTFRADELGVRGDDRGAKRRGAAGGGGGGEKTHFHKV